MTLAEGTRNSERGERSREESREEQRGRETVNKMDEAASTNDDWGSVDPDGAPGSQLLAEAGSATAVVVAAAADDDDDDDDDDVEVVSAFHQII